METGAGVMSDTWTVLLMDWTQTNTLGARVIYGNE